jgi:hypothetical protein
VCLRRLPAYCQALHIPYTAEAFVAHLKQRLREVTERVDGWSCAVLVAT